MEFTTTDGKLVVNEQLIQQKRLMFSYKRNQWIFVFLFLYFSEKYYNQIERTIANPKTMNWVGIILISIIFLLLLVVIIDALFLRSWAKTIAIREIKSIQTEISDEGLETAVILKLFSRRYKRYEFRTLEKQAEGFVDMLLSQNPALTVTPVKP